MAFAREFAAPEVICYNRHMGMDLQIDVGHLDASHRRALEEVIGRELIPSERLTISVSGPVAPSLAAKPAQPPKPRVGAEFLSSMIKQLVELRHDEEVDALGVLRASEHAFEAACQLITDAAIVSALGRRSFPRGCASTDSEGGVRIDWLRPNAAVCLLVPATNDRVPYIYHEVAGDGATESATVEALARWLGEIL